MREDDKEGLTYSLTAYYCDNLLANATEVDAIFYPSIAGKGMGNNFAIKPGQIFKAYNPKKVGLYISNVSGSYSQIDGGIINGENVIWGQNLSIDNPVPVNVRQIDPNDPRIFIAPWKNR